MYTKEFLDKQTIGNLKLILFNEFNITKGISNKKKNILIELILKKQQPPQPPQPERQPPQPQQPPQPEQQPPQPQPQQPKPEQQRPPQPEQQPPQPQQPQSILFQEEFKTEEDEIIYIKNVIEQLYESLQKFPIQTRNILLYPYFELKQLSIPEVDVVVEYEKERPRTISSIQKPIPIINQNDIANVLNNIEKKSDDTFKQIPFIRNNIKKCLGLI